MSLVFVLLSPLVFAAVCGNLLVFVAVSVERKLRSAATNKFIASLAFSDLLVGALVMPFAVYMKMNGDKWSLSEGWCRFHVCTAAFSTTASIVHLVAISVDRYFAIIFPTEYQRHSVQMRVGPYIVIIWVISLAMSLTTLLEKTDNSTEKICWISDPQYLLLSSLISFILPALIVIYLYVKIFRKLKQHMLLNWLRRKGPISLHTTSLPKVIVEEVRSRRSSHISRQRSNSGESKGSRSSRSASQPDVTVQRVTPLRFRSPTICADSLLRNKSNSLPHNNMDSPPPPPDVEPVDYIELPAISVPVNRAESPRKVAFESRRQSTGNMLRVPESDDNCLVARIHRESTATLLSVSPNVRSDSIVSTADQPTNTNKSSSGNQFLSVPVPASLSVPIPQKRHESCVSNNSSRTGSSASYSSDEVGNSIYSYGSSMTDDSSRRASAMSEIEATDDAATPRRRISALSGGKLRQLASQVTHAIRKKRRESAAIRRETRATRVVAAILVVFVLCWLPYFCAAVYRGISLGLSFPLNYSVHSQLYLISSWLGYAHSCFNPVIYTCLNSTFRLTFKRLLCCATKTRRGTNSFAP